MARESAARKEYPEPSGREFVMTRVLNAPREAVFKAWTEQRQVVRWWGPKGFTTPYCRIDLRPGGVFHYCMRSPDGEDYWGRGVYTEVAEPERLALFDSFSDEFGNIVEPSVYGMSPEWPIETLLVVTFDDLDGRTGLALRSDISTELAESSGARQGWEESLDRLAEYLSEG
ncbi:hypothetical protein ANRL2_01354 [Anaerolineae bacterium]|nr:hypothetical protein ANRL2_01354 [Anaerolineae bacterium]